MRFETDNNYIAMLHVYLVVYVMYMYSQHELYNGRNDSLIGGFNISGRQ